MPRRPILRRTLSLALLGLLVASGVALAYFLISQGSGSGSTTLGTPSGSLTLHVQSLPIGLTPGQSGTFDVTADNPSGNPGVIHSLTVGPFTVPNAGCGNAGDVSTSFSITWPDGSTGTTYTEPSPVAVAANSTGTNAFQASGPNGLLPTLNFKNNGDQSCLAGQTLTVAVTSS